MLLHLPQHPCSSSTRALRAARAAGAAALVLVLTAPAGAAAGTTGGPSGPCPDGTGVTVVVDSTDLGGDVETGCAPEAGVTGTEALAAAGFSEARDPSGYICAIGGRPDPCPTEFVDGEFWSYWTAQPGEEWQMYQEGSDTAVPAAGSVEGWRYSAEPPTVAAPEPGSAAPDASATEDTAEAGGDGDAGDDAATETPGSAAQDDATGAEDDGDAAGTPAEGAADGTSPTLPLVAGAVVVVALTTLLVLRRRRAATVEPGPGPAAEQD